MAVAFLSGRRRIGRFVPLVAALAGMVIASCAPGDDEPAGLTTGPEPTPATTAAPIPTTTLPPPPEATEPPPVTIIATTQAPVPTTEPIPVSDDFIEHIEHELGGPVPNGCGAEGGLDAPDAPLFSWLASLGTADDFKIACDAHDICYAQQEGKQQCDRQFREALSSVCTDQSFDPTCRVFADVYYGAVVLFGHEAYVTPSAWHDRGATLAGMDDEPPDGWLLGVERIGRSDEMLVVVLVENRGGPGEFRVRLRSSDGSLIDEEPDTFWKDLLPGQRHIFQLSTEFDPLWDVFNVGAQFEVQLVEQHDGVMGSESRVTPLPQGEIQEVAARRINNTFSDDEFEACVTVANVGEVLGEFRVELYASDGTLIDKEPDLSWRNVATGAETEICVGTEFKFPSISDLGSSFTVVVTDQHLGEMDRTSRSTP